MLEMLQFIMPYSSHIFIIHLLYWTECMHNQSSFHASKESNKIDSFLKNVMPILLHSLSNQKW